MSLDIEIIITEVFWMYFTIKYEISEHKTHLFQMRYYDTPSNSLEIN
jgi:hypothetical protein